jgi:ribosomal protein S18 acetylase RimI-like enzyme
MSSLGTSNPQFNIVDLSQHGTVESYIEPYKKLRLKSLQLNPEAFTSTYENEALFTVDVWEGRLKNPLASTIVAIPADAGAQPDWVGTVTLLGPISSDPKVSEGLDKQNTGGTAQYNIVALFTMPVVRRLGLGEILVHSATNLAKAKEEKRHTGAVRVDLIVDSRNLPAKCLYEKCGFTVTGESDISKLETRKDSITGLPASQRRRIVLAMEKHILLP